MTGTQLRHICDDCYRDRAVLRDYNPNLPEREAVFLVLYGSLSSLLDAPADYAPDIEATKDIYVAGVKALLATFAPAELAWQEIIAELAERLTLQD